MCEIVLRDSKIAIPLKMETFNIEIFIGIPSNILNKTWQYKVRNTIFDITVTKDSSITFQELDPLITYLTFLTKGTYWQRHCNGIPLLDTKISDFQKYPICFYIPYWYTNYYHSKLFSFDPEEIVIFDTNIEDSTNLKSTSKEIKVIQPFENINHFFIFKTLESASEFE